MKRLLLFLFALVLTHGLVFAAYAQESSDELTEDETIETEEDLFSEDDESVLEDNILGSDEIEEAAPLEAPYGDAEEIEMTKAEEKKEAKRKKVLREKIKKGGRINSRFIKHPNAKDGLYKITKKGDYLYKVKPSPKERGINVRMGILDAPNFVNNNNNASFNDIYGGDDIIFFVDYEWPMFFKNFSVKLGSGILFASGQGRLSSSGTEAQEKFTLIMLPNHAGAKFALKFWDTQWLIPYIEGGVGAYVFGEFRDDGQPAGGRYGLALNGYGIGGLGINLTGFSEDASLRLDAQYGINEVWLVVEARQHIGFGSFDITSTIFGGGIAVQF